VRTTKPRAKRTLDEMRSLGEEAEDRLVKALIAAQSTEEKLELVAKLKCLTQIAAEIAVLMNDYRMAADRARGTRPS
jgi:hypothetical protein